MVESGRGRTLQTSTVLALALALAPDACSRIRGFASRFVNHDSDAATSAPATSVGAGATATKRVAPSVNEAAEAARTAAIERADATLGDIQWMVREKTSVNPSKAGDGDVSSKCDALEAMRQEPGSANVPELDRIFDEGSSLCAFDVPLLLASESLDHLRGASSQASRLLMCTLAARELAKAKATRSNDPRVRREEGRREALCR